MNTTIVAAHPTKWSEQAECVIEFVEDDVAERLAALDQSLLEHRFDEAVKKRIELHLRYPRTTAINVGRAVAYFPIFEEELRKAGLPEALKYLPVVESALRIDAISPVGAEGLWQFMPGTAPEYGLRVDELIDERMDPQKATQAAIRYLTQAYEYLDEDWSLAIAAYNAGRGRIRKAMRRSGGKHFWAVKKHLPRETRKYVPAFIAAVYLTEFYARHDIEADFPSLDAQLIERLEVKNHLSFYRIAQVTGLHPDFVQRMNPAYQKGYLPATAEGHNLYLPKRVAPAMQTYLSMLAAGEDEPILPWATILEMPAHQDIEDWYASYTTYTTPGDSLESVAERLRIPASQLAIWNRLSPLDSIVEDQAIRYYRPVRYQHLPQRSWDLPTPLKLVEKEYLQSNNKQPRLLPIFYRSYIFLQNEKRVKSVVFQTRFPHMDFEHFLKINQLEEDGVVSAGYLLKIPRSGVLAENNFSLVQ